jgi:hypothetical protein
MYFAWYKVPVWTTRSREFFFLVVLCLLNRISKHFFFISLIYIQPNKSLSVKSDPRETTLDDLAYEVNTTVIQIMLIN